LITIDEERGILEVHENGEVRQLPLASAEAFEHASRAWLRAGWDAKYVYNFTWYGRPVIQLPDDLITLQEVFFSVEPDVVVETGIAHGGSLVFYASLCRILGKGRVVGIDVEIRPHNAKALRTHPLAALITVIEGDSTAPETVEQVRREIQPADRVLVVLDSNHTKAHVAAELEAYGPLVTPGSYIIATDGGIMSVVAGAPRTRAEWAWDNPRAAAEEFVADHRDFELAPPIPSFDESHVRARPSYFTGGWIKRVR
jgi:cephalosporin hydroxylase